MKSVTLYILVPFLFTIVGIFAIAASAQDIVVGEFASLTGSEATFGVNSSNGVELAKEEINNAGGVLGGRKIKIIIEDDQSKPGQPSAAVKKLIGLGIEVEQFCVARPVDDGLCLPVRLLRWK